MEDCFEKFFWLAFLYISLSIGHFVLRIFEYFRTKIFNKAVIENHVLSAERSLFDQKLRAELPMQFHKNLYVKNLERRLADDEFFLENINQKTHFLSEQKEIKEQIRKLKILVDKHLGDDTVKVSD